jgi:deoxyadenosine/deoxycytidine kinase
MKRLKKSAEGIDDVKLLLSRVDEASHNLKDTYYALFDNLNALFTGYPNLYKEIEMTVKLPTNEDAIDIAKFDEDLHQILNHFQDEKYLESYITPEQNSNQPE